MSLITKTETGLQISLDLLKKIVVRGNRRKFESGETLTLVDTGKTEKIGEEEYPIINLGPGRDVDLNVFANFYLYDDKLEAAIRNKGTKEECLDRDFKPTLIHDWLVEKGGTLPKSVKVVTRINAGAKQDYLTTDASKGEMRKLGYKLLEMDSAKEDIPAIFSSKGADPKKKESWRTIDRLAFQIVE